MFRKGRKFVALLLALTVICSTMPNITPVFAAEESEILSVDQPTTSVPTGRYEEAQTIHLTTATQNADIYYTLDGTLPDVHSLKYNGPISISKTTNLSAIAIKNGVASKGVTFSYIIKTKEKPLLQFVAMSDVHVGSHASADARYTQFFDTIGSIFPNPDAILVVGDMINDNGNDKPNDHVMVREIFEQNLARKQWNNTQIRMAIGNHDSTVAKVNEHYPTDWFTSQPNGYYESEIGGYHFLFLNGNNYNSDTGQRNWLKGRLAELTADPKNQNTPIFVNVHQPISNTVMDGQQASNPNLYTDLKDYPQVITFSGHSHLNISDDRSIYQKDFTSVNLGSMSYIESDRGYSQVTKKGLEGRFEFPVSQADFVEVYADRVEVDRIAFNADPGDIYTDGKWTAEPQPPFNSAGTVAGDKWVIQLKGSTNEAIKSNFKYTTANRNKVAPVFNSELDITNQDTVPLLSFKQAKDDQSMHHYEINVIDKRSGVSSKSVNVFSDYYFSPVPNAMNIPLEGLAPQTSYIVQVTAVDAYGNRSATLDQSFTAGNEAPELTPIDPSTMWKDLVVDMKLDGNLSDEAKDVTGLASLAGNVTYVDGKSNKAALIAAGNSNYIDLGKRDDLKFGAGSFTVSFWHKGNLSGDQTILSNKNWNSGGNLGWYIGPASTNGMTLNISDGTKRADITASSVGTEWHLFTITADRTNNLAKVYVDGTEKASGSIASLGTQSVDTTFNTLIGVDGNKGNGGATITIDDLRIWKRSLTATENKALSDSYKGVQLFTFEQLTTLIYDAASFQKNSDKVSGVSYPKDQLDELANQLHKARQLTASNSPTEIDLAYVELQWVYKKIQQAAIYSFIPKNAFTINSFSSYADNENANAANILDNDTATIWHSKWQEPAASFPHWVIIDMKGSKNLTGIGRTSRLSQTALEFPKDFELYASDQLSDLTDPAYLSNPANKAIGTFQKTWKGTSYQDFNILDKAIQGRYVKFVVTSTYNPTALFTSMSEIDFTGSSVLSADTLLQMSFENNLEDQSVNAIPAKPVKDPQFVKGRVGQALSIDSKSSALQYVDLGKPTSLQFGKDKNFSFAFWVKSPSVSGDPAILSNKNWDSGANVGYALALKGSALQWNFNTSGESRADAQIPNVVDGTWHHIAISHDRASGRVDFYKDGVPVNVTKVNGTNYQGIASTMTIAGRTGTLDTGLSTMIGNDGTGNYSNALQVQLDELHMYGRTLTAQEVSNMYNSAPPLASIEDFSGSLNLIGAKHTVQGTQFRYNLDLRTPDMTTKVDKAVVEIAYDPEQFEFVSASRATKTDASTPGIVRLELPGGNVYNIENPLEYAKSRISELKFNTLGASGQGIIEVKHADFYTGSTKLTIKAFDSAPAVIQIHAKASEDLNADGYVTIGDLALAKGISDEELADMAAQAQYQPYKRVVVIGIDGGGVAVSKDAPYWETPSSKKEKVGDRLQIPAIRNIIEHGAISYTAKTTLPSSSSPNWGSMINGVGYEKHGLYNDDTAAYTYSESWDYPTVFKKIREALPATKQTVFSTWSNIVQGHIEPSVGVEGYSLGDEADVAAFTQYAASGKAKDTSLIFFQLDDMDGAGHGDGFYTKSYYEQIKKTDKNIQTIYDALKNNHLLEDTLILMLPDHGGGKENADGTLGMATSHGQDEPLATTIFFAANGRTVATEDGKEKLLQGGNTRDLAATVLTALGLNPSIGDSHVIDGMFIPQTEQKQSGAADLRFTKLVDAATQKVNGYEVSINNATSDVTAIDLNVDSSSLIFSSIEPAQPGVKIVRKETVNGMTRIILTSTNGIQADAPILKLRVSPQEKATAVQITQAMIADAKGHETMPNLTTATKEVQISQATLVDLQVNGQSLIGFTPDQMNYAIRVPNNVSVAEVTYKVADPLLSVHVIGGKSLQVGENLVEVHVQAPDGSSNVYTIIVIRESESLPNQILLSDLRMNGETLPAFAPSTLNYNVTVPYSTSVTDITYTAYDPTSVVKITGSGALEVGRNVVKVTVTAQDGLLNIYTIIITRQPEAESSSNADLVDLRVNGTTIRGFASGQYNYELTVPYSTTVTRVTYTAADPMATVSITGSGDLHVGTNMITVTVTAQDGTKQIYTIAVMRENDTSTTPPTGGGNPGSSVTPPVVVKPELPAGAVVIPDELLTKSAEGNIILQLQADKNQVMIPIDQLDQIGNRDLEIQVNGVRAIMSSKVLNELRKLLPSTAKTATILLKMEAIQSNQLTITTPYSRVSDIMDFSLIMSDESGNKYSLKQFPVPVKITLPILNGTNPALAGIYRIEENGSFTYLGGTMNPSKTSLTVDLNHFSQYVVLSFQNSYRDVPESHWVYKTIQELSAKQIVKGQSDSMFNPSGSITRAEYAALLSRALSLTASRPTSFQDVVAGSWYEEAVNATFEAGIIQGVSEVRFDPNQQITREEMAAMLVRAYAYRMGVKPEASSFHATNDSSKVSSWAVTYVQGALEAKLLTVHQDGNFLPQSMTTRAEAAQSISNLLAKF